MAAWTKPYFDLVAEWLHWIGQPDDKQATCQRVRFRTKLGPALEKLGFYSRCITGEIRPRGADLQGVFTKRDMAAAA